MPPAMAAGTPEEVTYRSLCERDVELARTVEGGMLPRLAEAGVIETPAVVHLQFAINSRRPSVAGAARVRLSLPCQWCESRVSREVEARFEVLLATDETEAVAWDEQVGQDKVIVVAGERLDVPGLIEDELLLSIPERVCIDEDCPRRPARSAGAPVVETQNGLAGLAQLIKDKRRSSQGSDPEQR